MADAADILLVEDDEDLSEVLADLLAECGYKVATCVHGLQALGYLEANPLPALILLDWMMPVMDGPTLFRQMKLRPETSGLPVVFITARASQRDLDELKVLGAAGTISKPFSPKDLPEQLRAIWAALP